MEGPGLKCNQVHGVMVNDDTDYLVDFVCVTLKAS